MVKELVVGISGQTGLALLENRELRKTMGHSAWQLVKAHYTWDKVAEMTERAYFEYLESFPSGCARN